MNDQDKIALGYFIAHVVTCKGPDFYVDTANDVLNKIQELESSDDFEKSIDERERIVRSLDAQITTAKDHLDYLTKMRNE